MSSTTIPAWRRVSTRRSRAPTGWPAWRRSARRDCPQRRFRRPARSRGRRCWPGRTRSTESLFRNSACVGERVATAPGITRKHPDQLVASTSLAKRRLQLNKRSTVLPLRSCSSPADSHAPHEFRNRLLDRWGEPHEGSDRHRMYSCGGARRCRREGGGNSRVASSPACPASQNRRWSAGGDHAMTRDITLPAAGRSETMVFEGAGWFDPLEDAVRGKVRTFIEAILEEELEASLLRKRYERHGDGQATAAAGGHRHGHRERTLTGTFGAVAIRVPRARLAAAEGGTREWKSSVIPAYQRRTRQAEALIAGAYLSGTNTRRVRRALAALFGGTIGKDIVSRAWRKVATDWQAWNRRDLSVEPVVRLILDGTVVKVRLDRKATAISLLVVLGVRQDGQKILLAIKGGESEAAWRGVLDDLIARG